MSNSSRSNLGALVWRFLAEMHRHDAGRTLPILHASKLTTPQMAVLEFSREPRTVSAIAEHVGLSQPATSQMVEKLVRRGLVRRDLGAIDRRERSVRLSGKGRSLLEAVGKARVVRFDASLSVLPAALAQKLARVLSEVAVTLGAAKKPRPAARPTRTGAR